MTPPIKESKMYICPETDKPFYTREEAEKCYNDFITEKTNKLLIEKTKKEKEDLLKYQQNFIRLNLSNINDLGKLIQEKAKEFWNIECNISFSLHATDIQTKRIGPIIYTNTVNQSQQMPVFPIFKGRVTGTIKNYKLSPYENPPSISDVIFKRSIYEGNGFVGIYTDTGCPGTVNSLEMSIGCYMFLQDFPLIYQQYSQYQIDKTIDDENIKRQSKLYSDATNFVNSTPEIHEITHKINNLMKEKKELHSKLIENYISNNSIKLTPTSPEYQNSKNIFTHSLLIHS